MKEIYNFLIRKKCPKCNYLFYMKVTTNEKKEYHNHLENRGLIQEDMPSFDVFGREFVNTGYCPDCQEIIFCRKLHDKSRYFSRENLRKQPIAHFEELKYQNKMSGIDAITSEFANDLNYFEKYVYLFETGLCKDYYVDENENTIKPIKH